MKIDPKWITPEWSEAQILRVAELWHRGDSLRKIGEAMKKSQNSVHGKLVRIGLAAKCGSAPRPSPLKPRIEPAVVKAKPVPYGASTLPLLPSELAQKDARS